MQDQREKTDENKVTSGKEIKNCKQRISDSEMQNFQPLEFLAQEFSDPKCYLKVLH